jgi:hypothetical protein
MPIVITWYLLKLLGRWSTAAGNLSSGERLTPLSSHADGGRWPAGTLSESHIPKVGKELGSQPVTDLAPYGPRGPGAGDI